MQSRFKGFGNKNISFLSSFLANQVIREQFTSKVRGKALQASTTDKKRQLYWCIPNELRLDLFLVQFLLSLYTFTFFFNLLFVSPHHVLQEPYKKTFLIA